MNVQPESAANIPRGGDGAAALCVDLDGTLIASDMLYESVLLLIKKRPFDLLLLPFWLLKGKAHLKQQLADRILPDAQTLPYRAEILALLQEAKTQGRQLILATASDQRIADAVAVHLGIFNCAIGSDGQSNCSGNVKLACLQQRCGQGGFDYIGDSAADLPIWRAARVAYIVNPSRGLLSRLSSDRAPEKIITSAKPRVAALAKALRPHQWVKNLLLFVPLIMAHHFFNFREFGNVAIAFVAFSLCASAVYVVNDLLDIPSDRKHPSKRRRPFASGALPVIWGPPLIVLFLALAFALSFLALPLKFTALLALYLAMTTLYSLVLKQRLLLDVMFLAGLYTHRILAGGAAANVPVTHWLLAFSMFLFISLAFAKRYTELRQLQLSAGQGLAGRNYTVDDLSIIESVGPTSGYLAVLVLSLYIQNDVIHDLYHHPFFLWLICPLLLYWITRVWFFAKRGALHDDPILFALRDRVSWITAVCAGVLLVLAL